MEITCAQMDILLSFYIDGELSDALKRRVEEHLKECPSCKAKFSIIRSLFSDFKKLKNTDKKTEEVYSTQPHSSKQYQFFRNNLSAYIDNELPEEENVKIKKYSIINKKARKDLEDSYRISKLMRESFKKTNSEIKPDIMKNVFKNLNCESKNELGFNPVISVAFAFVVSVILISAIVIYTLSI